MAQGVSIATDALQDGSTALMVALDAGHSEIASMLYSRMNIKCSVSLGRGRAGGAGLWGGMVYGDHPKGCMVSCLLNLHGAPVRK